MVLVSKYTHVVYDIIETVIKLMLITGNVQCESGFNRKGKAILKHSMWAVSPNYKYPGDILSLYTCVHIMHTRMLIETYMKF